MTPRGVGAECGVGVKLKRPTFDSESLMIVVIIIFLEGAECGVILEHRTLHQ